MKKLIMLDFTGVVVSGGHWWMAKQLARRFHRNPKELYDIFYTKYFNMLAVKKISERDSWIKPIQELTLPLDWRFARKFYLNSHKLKKQTVALANRLRKRGYIVILLTKNHKPYFEYEKKKFQLAKYFDALINTQDPGLPKMSPKTLQYVCRRFRVQPKEIIYIDDQEPNLAPARKKGVQTILYTTFTTVQRKLRTLL